MAVARLRHRPLAQACEPIYLSTVIAGPVPATRSADVMMGGRDKPGHDEKRFYPNNICYAPSASLWQSASVPESGRFMCGYCTTCWPISFSRSAKLGSASGFSTNLL